MILSCPLERMVSHFFSARTYLLFISLKKKKYKKKHRSRFTENKCHMCEDDIFLISILYNRSSPRLFRKTRVIKYVSLISVLEFIWLIISKLRRKLVLYKDNFSVSGDFVHFAVRSFKANYDTVF